MKMKFLRGNFTMGLINGHRKGRFRSLHCRDNGNIPVANGAD
jgi:hypothetical protein